MCMGGVLLILLTAFDIFASSAGILFLCLWATDSWLVLEYFLSCLHCTQFCPVCFLSGRFAPFFGSDQMLVHPGEYEFVCCSYLTWALLMYARGSIFKKVMMKCSTKGYDKIHLLISHFHFIKRSNFCKYSSLAVFKGPFLHLILRFQSSPVCTVWWLKCSTRQRQWPAFIFNLGVVLFCWSQILGPIAHAPIISSYRNASFFVLAIDCISLFGSLCLASENKWVPLKLLFLLKYFTLLCFICCINISSPFSVSFVPNGK